MSEKDLLTEIKRIQRELDILKCFDVPDTTNGVLAALMTILTQNGDLLYLENIPSITNTVSPSGNYRINDPADQVEYILAGCDLMLADFIGIITIAINLWGSNQIDNRNATVRLRRDNLAGAELMVWYPIGGFGSILGHTYNVSDTYIDAAPTTGRYVLTIQAESVPYSIYSDTRGFTLTGTVHSSLKALHAGAVGTVLTIGADGLPYWA